ncbi:MAG: tRNA (guanosine(46)-N7)-methyltransferase TrmB, partial [Roseiflexus sp.]|nr:tRNA (guanosine(46)-N7)-methyltransferase TrmB [Roseiflexus sp.]
MRVRQHVNPLSLHLIQPIQLPDWSLIYAQVEQPLHIDIGSAKGVFLLKMAQQQPQWNFLGLEIRRPLVEYANQQKMAHDLPNLHFMFAQVNVHLESILESLPAGVLHRVTIQFPDPWFKRKQQKRRIVKPELVATIARYLQPGGDVFLQSDVQEVALEMFDYFRQHPAFV